jgi:hypothetical protein
MWAADGVLPSGFFQMNTGTILKYLGSTQTRKNAEDYKNHTDICHPVLLLVYQ